MGLIQIGRSRTYELRRVAQAAGEEVRTYRACFCSIDSSEF